MDGLVEKVREAIGDECPEANCDDPDCGQCNATARAAIEAVLDALAERAQESIDAAFERDTTGATTGRAIVMASGDRRARVAAWTAMLATLRKQALG